MIKKIKLKYGRAPKAEPQVLEAVPITVFVGPNNSGKSLILSEIRNFCLTGAENPNARIIDSIELEGLNDIEIDLAIKKIRLTPQPDEKLAPNYIIVGKGDKRHYLDQSDIKKFLSHPNIFVREVCTFYLSFKTLILNGVDRIRLIDPQVTGNLNEPNSSLQVLFADNEKRQEMRRIVHDAFQQYLVIDPTQTLGKLYCKLSNTAPTEEIEECGIHRAAREFHSKTMPITNASDGVKAFTGIVTQVIAGDPSILLLDEPEAFLHPAMTIKLGKELASVLSDSSKRLFVSTHSPDFVMGCIQSSAPANIVRLTYREGQATARILPNKEIMKLMRNPLLRSIGVLSALFYEFVVVTESDTDRAFYQEINERLLTFCTGKGIPNCLFLNAQNKQTIKTIIKPLRELGIPVAGIVDIDVLKEGGVTWTSLLDSGSVPEIERAPLGAIREALKRQFEASGKDMTNGGISLLEVQEQEPLQNLFSKLAEYGLFVVPNGELESWLKSLGASGHGPKWLIDVFERMGEDPNSTSYLKPSQGDVWAYMELLTAWFLNPNRKGIPN